MRDENGDFVPDPMPKKNLSGIKAGIVASGLRQMKRDFLNELEARDLSSVASVEYGIRYNIGCIDTLLGVLENWDDQ